MEIFLFTFYLCEMLLIERLSTGLCVVFPVGGDREKDEEGRVNESNFLFVIYQNVHNKPRQ